MRIFKRGLSIVLSVVLFTSAMIITNLAASAAEEGVYPGLTVSDVTSTDSALLTDYSVSVTEADGVKSVVITAERTDTSAAGYVFSINGTAMNEIGYGNSYTWTPTEAGTYEIKTDRYNFSMAVTATMTAKFTITDEFLLTETKPSEAKSSVSVEVLEAGENLCNAKATIMNQGQDDQYIEIKPEQSGLSMPYETIFSLDGTVVSSGYAQFYKWTPEKAGSYTFTITVTSSAAANQKCVFVVNVDESYFGTESTTYMYGDADLDGEINVRDATIIQKYLANILLFTPLQLKAADVNNDGGPTVQDATMVQKYCAKMISSFPAGTTFTS